jgi:hypothetical protein
MNHGNARSVRECGCNGEFKPGLLPHFLSELLVIKPCSPKERRTGAESPKSPSAVCRIHLLGKANISLEGFSKFGIMIKRRRALQ